MLRIKSQVHGKRNLINGMQREKKIKRIHTKILMVLYLGDDIKTDFHFLLPEYLDFLNFFE